MRKCTVITRSGGTPGADRTHRLQSNEDRAYGNRSVTRRAPGCSAPGSAQLGRLREVSSEGTLYDEWTMRPPDVQSGLLEPVELPS